MNIYLMLFFSIPLIGFLDYIVLRKWSRCEKCGHQINGIFCFMLPTFIEVLLFISGIAIGIVVY